MFFSPICQESSYIGDLSGSRHKNKKITKKKVSKESNAREGYGLFKKNSRGKKGVGGFLKTVQEEWGGPFCGSG